MNKKCWSVTVDITVNAKSAADAWNKVIAAIDNDSDIEDVNVRDFGNDGITLCDPDEADEDDEP